MRGRKNDDLREWVRCVLVVSTTGGESGDLVEVAVQLPVRGLLTYLVPAGLRSRIGVGQRVLVPVGGRKVTGVVVGMAAGRPPVEDVRPLDDVLDTSPALDRELVDLCLWVADYYEAPPGEVIRAALPAGTGVESKLEPSLTAKGRALLGGCAEHALPAGSIDLLSTVASGRRVSSKSLALLCEQGFVDLAEVRTAPRTRARMAEVVQLGRAPSQEEQQQSLRKSAARRAQVLEAVAGAGGALDLAVLAKEIKGSRPVVKQLVEQGLLVRTQREVARDPWSDTTIVRSEPPTPTQAQANAIALLVAAAAARKYQSFLVHGVTGSGKTEVYLRAIAEVLAAGGGALVLVPEIALTPQLASRFRSRFGDQVAVLHSGLSGGQRFDQWRRLRGGGDARIALGARSAVFAPVPSLGIIVVDEEHDPSFKQEEGVRYHARDVALVRAKRAGVPCVLGSATPSLEAYARAREGKHQLIELLSRPTPQPLPEVQIVDMRCYRPAAESLVTAPLAAAIKETLGKEEQVILFLNRRGFATFVLCVGCGHAFRCCHCSVSLTYHQAADRLRCHYCGHSERVPDECPKCRGSGTIKRLGLGTERIEQALLEHYPQARIRRLDRDTASGHGVRDILEQVAARQVDILIGTQMVTKGHDFPGVTLVGVLLADTGLSLPDFRAAERTFQLLTQVAGRAGRGDRPGRVIIQTHMPDHVAIRCASNHDYLGFFDSEVAVRAELGYPPSGSLIAVRIEGQKDELVREVALRLGSTGASLLAAANPGPVAAAVAAAAADGTVTILGPVEAPLRRLKGQTRWRLWLKSDSRSTIRTLARRMVADLGRLLAGVRVTLDVDPVAAL
ncbi:MAG: primosomal protein N' [Pseudomonadota bacterium]